MNRFIISIMILLVLMSCTKTSNKIGFLIPNLTLKRFVKEKEFFTNKVKELGGEVVVQSANSDDNLQIQQAKELLSQGVKVLVICSVNAVTAAAIVREAHTKNVPVIAYDRLIKNCDLDFFLTFDNEEVGKQMAEYVIRIKPKGKYILLGGDKSDQNAIWVKNGQYSVLKDKIKSGDITILYDTYIENWSGSEASNQISKYLDLSNDIPDVILSSNDGMATAVIELLKEQHLNKQIIITGQDAELDACKNIVSGNQTMTVYKSLKSLATKAAELSMTLARGEKIKDNTKKLSNGQVDVPSILLSPTTIDKSNIQQLVTDGFITADELNN